MSYPPSPIIYRNQYTTSADEFSSTTRLPRMSYPPSPIIYRNQYTTSADEFSSTDSYEHMSTTSEDPSWPATSEEDSSKEFWGSKEARAAGGKSKSKGGKPSTKSSRSKKRAAGPRSANG